MRYREATEDCRRHWSPSVVEREDAVALLLQGRRHAREVVVRVLPGAVQEDDRAGVRGGGLAVPIVGTLGCDVGVDDAVEESGQEVLLIGPVSGGLGPWVVRRGGGGSRIDARCRDALIRGLRVCAGRPRRNNGVALHGCGRCRYRDGCRLSLCCETGTEGNGACHCSNHRSADCGGLPRCTEGGPRSGHGA